MSATTGQRQRNGKRAAVVLLAGGAITAGIVIGRTRWPSRCSG